MVAASAIMLIAPFAISHFQFDQQAGTLLRISFLEEGLVFPRSSLVVCDWGSISEDLWLPTRFTVEESWDSAWVLSMLGCCKCWDCLSRLALLMSEVVERSG